jgi:hypothetical protein
MTRYEIQRKTANGAEWSRLSVCNSAAYARLVAAAGLRRRMGVSYRMIDTQTGAETALRPDLKAKAA